MLSDAEIARKLQREEFEKENDDDCIIIATSWDSRVGKRTKEVFDPNPDIHELFLHFNELYFDSLLSSVEVKWSTRMTLCAGLCCYEGFGGLCCIKLSEPLLKYRPRADMIDTLLHEMIHALLFVTRNNRDRSGHGSQFVFHMNRINAIAGTSISVFHSFHDEVNEYRKHWWRCDGKCRDKPPYFGFVKRAMNRKPSKHDSWWAEHQMGCGGNFVKVKEPEKSVKKKKRKEDNGQKSIKRFLK